MFYTIQISFYCSVLGQSSRGLEQGSLEINLTKHRGSDGERVARAQEKDTGT